MSTTSTVPAADETLGTPINHTRIYHIENDPRETTRHFWRNIFGGSAANRFHRRGLGKLAQTQIRSARMLAGCDDQAVEVPASVNDIENLLAWLRKRGEAWAEAFALDQSQVTVNKNFAEPFTRIEDADEVALVPRSR